jgi:hypothetical protein
MENRDITFLLQGPIHNEKYKGDLSVTEFVIKSIRENFSGSKILISSWKKSNINNLDYDEIVLYDDPGSDFLIQLDGSIGPYNLNRQLIGTKNALNHVKTKYCVKTRTDIHFKTNAITKRFKSENYKRIELLKIFDEKIVTLPTINPNRRSKFLFNICDWIFFGLTSDIKKIYSCNPIEFDRYKGNKNINGNYFLYNNFQVEQYIWIHLVKEKLDIEYDSIKDYKKELIEISEISYVNNFLPFESNVIGIDWLKAPGSSYSAKAYLSHSGLYTKNEYLKIYKKHIDKKIFIKPKPLEKLAYIIIYNIRWYLFDNNKKIYKFLLKTYRFIFNKKISKKLIDKKIEDNYDR